MSRKALGRGLDALFAQSSPFSQDFVELDIDRLQPSSVQPRTVFNENKLEELAQSIRQSGIIQPLVVRRYGERFQIIAGERRWRAAQRAELLKVPCIVKEVAEEDVLELSLIENIQREELNPIEEAHAYQKLLESHGFTQEDVGKRVGKDRSSIANALRLLKLPSEVQKLVESDELSTGHARALLSVDSPELQIKLAREISSKKLSVREVERLAKRTQQPGSTTKLGPPTSYNSADAANLLAAEAKLSKRLGAPVKIKSKRSGGIIEIKFSSAEDLSRLFDTLIQTQLSQPRN